MTRPSGADDHYVGVELVVWEQTVRVRLAGGEYQAAPPPPLLSRLLVFACNVVHRSCRPWTIEDVAEACGVDVELVERRGVSVRAAVERSAVEGLLPSEELARRGWCVGLYLGDV